MGALEIAILATVVLLALASVAGQVWLTVVAFRTHPAWGVATLLGLGFVFALVRWDVARRPALLAFGTLVAGVGAAVAAPLLVGVRMQPTSALALPSTSLGSLSLLADADARRAQAWIEGEVRSCEPGTVLRGARPPAGTGVWCERPDGVKQGPYAAWDAAGHKARAGVYRDGLEQGVWLRWGRFGQLEAAATFADGLQHGPMVTFGPGGEPQQETRWVRGVPAG